MALCLCCASMMRILPTGIALSLLLGGSLATAADAGDGNDYPTQARAEYVFACMASNGQTQQALRQCACAIDVIASVLPFDKYEAAETVQRMRRGGGGGYLADMFRSAIANSTIRELEEAEAEGEIRCF